MWGNEPSHSQMSSHFGSWNLNGLFNFQKAILGVKFIGLKSSLYYWKDFETQMPKMSLHDPFGHLKHKLCPKERARNQIADLIFDI